MIRIKIVTVDVHLRGFEGRGKLLEEPNDSFFFWVFNYHQEGVLKYFTDVSNETQIRVNRYTVLAKLKQKLVEPRTKLGKRYIIVPMLTIVASIFFCCVARGLTGVFVQLLVIFVFQGLVGIIDDMDHSIDTRVVIFNAQISDV